MVRLAWLTLALALGCGGPVDHRDVASQAREAASIAAQGALLADRADAVTDAYRRGYAEELRDQLTRCEKELAIEAGSVDGRAARLRSLAGELRMIRQRIR